VSRIESCLAFTIGCITAVDRCRKHRYSLLDGRFEVPGSSTAYVLSVIAVLSVVNDPLQSRSW